MFANKNSPLLTNGGVFNIKSQQQSYRISFSLLATTLSTVKPKSLNSSCRCRIHRNDSLPFANCALISPLYNCHSCSDKNCFSFLMPLIMKNHCSMRLSTVLSVGIKRLNHNFSVTSATPASTVSLLQQYTNCNKIQLVFSNVSVEKIAQYYLMRIKSPLCKKGVDVPVPDHPQSIPL